MAAAATEGRMEGRKKEAERRVNMHSAASNTVSVLNIFKVLRLRKYHFVFFRQAQVLGIK